MKDYFSPDEIKEEVKEYREYVEKRRPYYSSIHMTHKRIDWMSNLDADSITIDKLKVAQGYAMAMGDFHPIFEDFATIINNMRIACERIAEASNTNSNNSYSAVAAAIGKMSGQSDDAR